MLQAIFEGEHILFIHVIQQLPILTFSGGQSAMSPARSIKLM